MGWNCKISYENKGIIEGILKVKDPLLLELDFEEYIGYFLFYQDASVFILLNWVAYYYQGSKTFVINFWVLLVYCFVKKPFAMRHKEQVYFSFFYFKFLYGTIV